MRGLGDPCSAVKRLTELPRQFFTGETISQFGHKQSFEQTNKRSECASIVKVIASIEDPLVIRKILAHLNDKVSSDATALLPECRGPPQAKLFKGL
jgi:hypothetical protein